MHKSPRLKEVAIQGPANLAGANGGNGVLSFSEMIVVLDELAEMARPPEVVRFEGFDLRSETLDMVEYARRRRLNPRIRLSEVSLSNDAIEELSSETRAVIVIPIEASVSPSRGDRMIRAAEHAAALGVTVEIETLLHPSDLHVLPALARFIRASGFSFWGLDFLGDPARESGLLHSADNRRAFESLASLKQRMRGLLEIREAPSFTRFLRERSRRGHEDLDNVRVITSRDTLFISARGEVMPGRSLRVPVGSVRSSEIETINARSSLLALLRDPRQLRGRCGSCELNEICGGSRARAWRVSRNPLAEDPGCYRAPAHRLDAAGGRRDLNREARV